MVQDIPSCVIFHFEIKKNNYFFPKIRRIFPTNTAANIKLRQI